MIRPGLCNSYKREILSGEHRKNHTYFLALYTDDADISPKTTAYHPKGECKGLGYTAGGIELTGFSVSGEEVGCLDFDDIHLDRATLATDGGLIYNASLGGKAVAVVRFDETVRSTNGPFDLDMPPVGESTSVVRIA